MKSRNFNKNLHAIKPQAYRQTIIQLLKMDDAKRQSLLQEFFEMSSTFKFMQFIKSPNSKKVVESDKNLKFFSFVLSNLKLNCSDPNTQSLLQDFASEGLSVKKKFILDEHRNKVYTWTVGHSKISLCGPKKDIMKLWFRHSKEAFLASNCFLVMIYRNLQKNENCEWADDDATIVLKNINGFEQLCLEKQATDGFLILTQKVESSTKSIKLINARLKKQSTIIDWVLEYFLLYKKKDRKNYKNVQESHPSLPQKLRRFPTIQNAIGASQSEQSEIQITEGEQEPLRLSTPSIHPVQRNTIQQDSGIIQQQSLVLNGSNVYIIEKNMPEAKRKVLEEINFLKSQIILLQLKIMSPRFGTIVTLCEELKKGSGIQR